MRAPHETERCKDNLAREMTKQVYEREILHGEDVTDNIFFERTPLDEYVSIDIAEKYKVMFLGDHNHATKRGKKEKHKQRVE